MSDGENRKEEIMRFKLRIIQTANTHMQSVKVHQIETKQNPEHSKPVLVQPPNSIIKHREGWDVGSTILLGSKGFS